MVVTRLEVGDPLAILAISAPEVLLFTLPMLPENVTLVTFRFPGVG